MATDIFGGSGVISALYGIEETTSTVTFSDGVDFTKGFLVEQYGITWARQIITKRVFNLAGRIAITGAGQGTLTLQGMVGAADEFQSLIDQTSSADICKNINCTISANSGFALCEGEGQNRHTVRQQGAVEFICKGIMLSNISMGGQISDANALMTTGNLVFTITGLDIISSNNTTAGGDYSRSSGGNIGSPSSSTSAFGL